MKLSPYRALLLFLSLPVLLGDYFSRRTGRQYSVGLLQKLILLTALIRNNVCITSGSNFVEQLMMATEILSIPADIDGCVVECGAYKGASTSALSLVAASAGRKLHVFDSFAGLPEPSQDDRAHRVIHSKELHTYQKGGWNGSLSEVQHNVSCYGSLAVCDFHVGYFDTTLPSFTEPCVLVFADVDLRESLETCVRCLWPLLVDGGKFYTHEATHLTMADVFFRHDWWEATLKTPAPGLVGAGTGLGLIPRPGGFGSAIGYAVKSAETVELTHKPQ